MNKQETIAFLKGKLVGLRWRKRELIIFRQNVNEDISIAKDELKQWENKD